MNLNIGYLSLDNPLYPQILKEIKNPPKKIYYFGNIELLNRKDLFPLAVVGSRLSDSYGQEVIDEIFSSNILDKVLVISGLAKGIDTLAHKKAHYTIAIIGTGIKKESFYPQENWSIFEEIINKDGLIISEYPPETKAHSKNFPARNRIIAGLSKAVLVVQAKKRSGAMITARLALENGRDVLAIPGSILNELSETCNHLISQGAIPINSSDDLKNCLTQN